MWTTDATDEVKAVFQENMLVGMLKGAEAAADNIAYGIKNNKNWIIIHGNQCTMTSIVGNSLGNKFPSCQDLPSLEPT